METSNIYYECAPPPLVGNTVPLSRRANSGATPALKGLITPLKDQTLQVRFLHRNRYKLYQHVKK